MPGNFYGAISSTQKCLSVIQFLVLCRKMFQRIRLRTYLQLRTGEYCCEEYREKLTYGRLDGLNKDISEWDQGYYGNLYNEQCHALRMYVFVASG